MPGSGLLTARERHDIRLWHHVPALGGGSVLYDEQRPGHAVTTTISPDGSLPRPSRIQTSGASTNFDSGAYGYDGAGNIRTVGSDTFTYDSLSRLATANIRDDAGTNHPETFSPDRYGNIGRERLKTRFIPARS